jgi:hypothetical protein
VRTWRAILWVSGAAVFAVGLAGLLRHARQTRPGSWLTFLLGGLAVHDAVLVPLVAAVSWVLVRWVPRAVRPVVAGGLVVAGALVAISVPVVGGYGRLANNPSILPSHHYGRNLVLTLVVVAALTAALARAKAVRSR